MMHLLMEDNKKKRSSNYTAAEKEMLLELIKRYQHIIENKETKAQMIFKKRDTWDSVCQQYNAVAVSGSRTWQQLRHLYENLKQRSKKNIAKANHLQFYEKSKEIQKKASIDKKEINRTGGGAYKSTLTGQDEQILALAGCQIKPLSNPYDDAALYFGDLENHTMQNEMDTSSEVIIMNKDNLDHDTTFSNINWITDNKLCTVTSIIAGKEDITITEEQNSKKPSKVTSTVTSNIKDDQEVTTANMNQDHNKLETLSYNTKRKPSSFIDGNRSF